MNKHVHAARQCATYFQVPLCALAYGCSDRERLDAIIAYGVMEAGAKRWSKLNADERQRLFETEVTEGRLPRDFERNNTNHAIAVCGASVTNVTLSTVKRTLCEHAALSNFYGNFQQRHGDDAMVRLKTSLVFEARDGKGITPRELCVLAAIYSVIGRKQGPVLISQNRIRWRALGYKSKQVKVAELPRRKDDAQPLSNWQLRSLLDRLQARKFFARVTYGRRLSYYSHRMTETELRKAVIEMKTIRLSTKTLRRFDDTAMTDAIRNQRAFLEGKRPATLDASQAALTGRLIGEDAGLTGHHMATTAPKHARHCTTTLIESPIMKTLVNKNASEKIACDNRALAVTCDTTPVTELSQEKKLFEIPVFSLLPTPLYTSNATMMIEGAKLALKNIKAKARRVQVIGTIVEGDRKGQSAPNGKHKWEPKAAAEAIKAWEKRIEEIQIATAK
jgi:hypothetical protein